MAEETLELSDEYLENGQNCRVQLLRRSIIIQITLKCSKKNVKLLFIALRCTVCKF